MIGETVRLGAVLLVAATLSGAVLACSSSPMCDATVRCLARRMHSALSLANC